MPEIKLTYFDARGRAEPARLLLAYSGLKYEDYRHPLPFDLRDCIPTEEWKEAKKTLVYGQLPVLTWNGEDIYTSLTIDR